MQQKRYRHGTGAVRLVRSGDGLPVATVEVARLDIARAIAQAVTQPLRVAVRRAAGGGKGAELAEGRVPAKVSSQVSAGRWRVHRRVASANIPSVDRGVIL